MAEPHCVGPTATARSNARSRPPSHAKWCWWLSIRYSSLVSCCVCTGDGCWCLCSSCMCRRWRQCLVRHVTGKRACSLLLRTICNAVYHSSSSSSSVSLAVLYNLVCTSSRICRNLLLPAVQDTDPAACRRLRTVSIAILDKTMQKQILKSSLKQQNVCDAMTTVLKAQML